MPGAGWRRAGGAVIGQSAVRPHRRDRVYDAFEFKMRSWLHDIEGRPALDHVLVGAAADHDGSDLTEQPQRGAVAPIAVVDSPRRSGWRASR
jgi:hypothetical protein